MRRVTPWSRTQGGWPKAVPHASPSRLARPSLGLRLKGGGWWIQPPPPSPGGPEFLEVPKKMFGLNQLAPKAPEKMFDWPGRQFGPIFWGGGVQGGGVGTRPWWLALLACGGAYWPLAFEPSAIGTPPQVVPSC